MNIYKLIPGTEKKEDVTLLFMHTKTDSQPLMDAVNEVLVNGATPLLAAHKHGTTERQVFRAIAAIQRHYTIHEKLNEARKKRNIDR